MYYLEVEFSEVQRAVTGCDSVLPIEVHHYREAKTKQAGGEERQLQR